MIAKSNNFVSHPLALVRRAVCTIAFASMALAAPALGAAESWSGSGGPGQGGLIRGMVAVSGNTTLYAAVYGTGVMKSLDGGSTWTLANTGLANKRVMSIRSDPSDGTAQTLLVATEGGGVFRTIDGAANWAASNTGLQCGFVRNLRFVPAGGAFYSGTGYTAAANHVYAATQCEVNSGVYRSVDGGVNWSLLSTGMPASVAVNNFQINSAGNNPAGQFIRATTFGNGVYQSNDGGSTWLPINGSGASALAGPNGLVVYDFAAISGATNTAYLALVEGSGVWRSTDGGSTWSNSNTGLPVTPPNVAALGGISTTPGTPQLAYITLAGHGVFVSLDRGASWSALGNSATQLPPARVIQADPNTAANFYALTFAGIYKSADSGINWAPLLTTQAPGYAHSSSTDPGNPLTVLAAVDTIYRSTDGGTTWVKSGTGLTSIPISVRFAHGLTNTAIVGTQDGGVFKSIDGGVTWAPSNSGLPVTVGMDARVQQKPLNTDKYGVSLDGRGVYITENAGATWIPMSTGLSGNALNVLRLTSDPGNGERLFAVTRGGLFSMGNGGAPDTWTPVNGTVDGGTAGIVGAGARAGNLAIDPGNPSHLYFAYFFPNVDNTAMPHTGLLKSTDNGATWVTLPGMNKLVSAVAVIRDGSNLSIYAGLWDEGAAGGVFKSVDGGANWTQIGTGLLSNYVRSFETQGRPAAKLLRVATAAGGIQNFADGSTAALTDINTRLAAFGAVINSKTSTTLLASDLLPFFDANFKHEGWDAGYWSARLVESLNGGSVGAGSVSGIRSLLTDGAGNPVAHTEGSTTITSPQTGGQPMSMTWGDIGSDGPPFAYWRQTGGVWNLYGDQAPGRFEVHARLSNQICNNGVNCNSQVYQNVAFQADTPQGTFTGVSAQGPGLSTATPLNSQGTNGTAPYLSDSWGLWPYPPILASFPPPGTGYIFTAALAGGGTQQIVRQVPRWTNETISMSGPAGHSVANANLGGTLNINWTMPSSFTAAFVNIWLNTASANGVCNFDITPDSLPPSTTSFAVTMPAATCNGAPVADNVSTMMPATLTVNVIGVNGEETEVQWTFGTPIPSGGGDTSPPNQPTISSYSEPVPGSQVTINWTLVTDNPSIGGAGMANYVVRRYPTPGQPTPLATLDAASIMYTDTTVAPGTFYAYSVQACDAAVPSNCSAESTPFGITTGGGGGGSSLSIPSATITLDGQATDWSAINALATDVQGDMVAGYTGSTLSGSDIKALYAAKDSQYLYLRLDLWDTFNTQFGNWPAPNRGSYRFSIVTNSTSVPSLSLGVAYGVSGPEVGQWSLGYNGAGTFPGMTADTGYQYVAVNAGVLELKIPLASMGNPTAFIGIQTAVNDCCTDQGVSTTLDSALAGSVTGAVSWTTKTAMPTARWGAASGVVSGKLYVAGGWNGTSSLATLEVYDPATDTWTTKAPMPTARNGAGAAVINGKLYVVGGDIAQSQKLTTLEVYDLATDAWTTKAAMPTARSGPAVVSINGLLYAAGGCQGWCAPVTNVLEAYDPATDTWSAKAAMPTGRGSASTEVVNNLLYVMGGCCGSSAPESELMGKTIEVYDPATNAWTTRTQHVIGSGNIAGLLSGMIYVAKSTDTEVYNSAADTWSSLSPMSVARSYAAGGVINGTFYVAGGNIATGGTAALEALSVAPDSQAPSVPSAAAATASGSTQINLSWNASTDNVGVTAYKVYRGGTLLATLGNVTSYSDTGVSTSVSYSYTVAACDAAGNCSAPSTASNSVTLQPPATAPGAPTAVSASPGNTQATVSFSAPGSNGGAAITSYTVTPSPGGISASGSASPITVTGLSNGTAYTFTVTATNSVGTGAASAASNSVTPSTNPTFTPALVTGFNLLGNSLNTTLDVMSIFGNQTSPTAVTNDIATVWKWDAANLKWQFHSPLLTTAANADYAASHNYDVLTSIAAGEGYWVNALTAMNLPPQSAAAFNWNSFSFANLPSGFNLIAHAGNVTPSQFNSNISVVPPTAGTIPTDNFATLWAWDAGNVTWFFYSPLLESSGGLAAVKSYADSHFFEHFQDFNKKIDIGVGFWVNKF